MSRLLILSFTLNFLLPLQTPICAWEWAVLFDPTYVGSKMDSLERERLELNFYNFFTSGEAQLLLHTTWYHFEGKYSGINVGAGLRKKIDSGIFGLNGYLDVQHYTRNLKGIGFGGEFFSRWINFTANAYLPISKQVVTTKRTVYDNYSDGYEVNCECQNHSALRGELLLFKDIRFWFTPRLAVRCRPIVGFYALYFAHCHHRFGGSVGVRWEFFKHAYIEQKNFFDKKGWNRSLRIGCVFLFPGTRPEMTRTIMRNSLLDSMNSCHMQTNY